MREGNAETSVTGLSAAELLELLTKMRALHHALGLDKPAMPAGGPSLAVWLAQHTIIDPDGFVVKEDLRNAYAEACRAKGRPVLASSEFSRRLLVLCPAVRLGNRRLNRRQVHVFNGIQMNCQGEPGQ